MSKNRGKNAPKGGIFTPIEREILAGKNLKALKGEDRAKYYTAKNSLTKKILRVENYIENLLDDIAYLRACDVEELVDMDIIKRISAKLMVKIWENDAWDGEMRKRIKETVDEYIALKKSKQNPFQNQENPKSGYSERPTDDIKEADNDLDRIAHTDSAEFLNFLSSLDIKTDQLSMMKYVQTLDRGNNYGSYHMDIFRAKGVYFAEYRDKKFVMKDDDPKRRMFIGFDILQYLYSKFDHEWGRQFENLENKYPDYRTNEEESENIRIENMKLVDKIPKMDGMCLDWNAIYLGIKKFRRPYKIRRNNVKKICAKLAKAKFLIEEKRRYSVNMAEESKRGFIWSVTVNIENHNKIPAWIRIGK